VPLVVLGRPSKSTKYDSVHGDDATGARLAVEHLIVLGHRRISHITHRDPGRARTQDMPQMFRAAAYRQVIEAHGLGEAMDVVDASFTEHGGYTAAKNLLSRMNPPTAIFAGADIAAFGVLSAAHELGVLVPDKLSIVGYDNSTMAALRPLSLTTVEQMGELAGSQAAHLVIDRIAGRRQAAHLSFQPELVVRATTAPLA
jgi:LacI family transcriptional regulator